MKATFSFGESEKDLKEIGTEQSLIVVAEGNGNMFNGAGVGVYASANGKRSSAKAYFDWFEYLPANK